MGKIIFLYPYSFTNRDYHRFGLKYLEDKGYKVEVWIVADGLTYKSKLKISAGLYSGNNLFDVSLLQFRHKVKKNLNSIFILCNYQNAIYMSTMAKYRCHYIIYEGTGKILEDYSRQNILRPKDLGVFENLLRQLINLLQQTYHKKVFQIGINAFKSNLPQYVFLGNDIKNKWLQCVRSDKKIYIHSYDYDRYIEIRENKINEKCIVYIDEGWGNLHQDMLLFNYFDPWKDNAQIWIKLEKIFNTLEERFRLPVVVAGHPHVKYKSRTLCNRKIILNRTPELIQNAKFVIMQWSTVVSLVILFKKDILVLIDNDLKKTDIWYQYYLANYKYFRITPCNMDTPKMAESPWKYIHKINEQVAKKYIEEYIKKPGTPDKLFIEVVEEKIKEMQCNEMISKTGY